MEKMKSNLVYQRSWCNLSAEAVQLINSKLKHKFLRSVCQKWGTAIPPPQVQLHTLLPVTLFLHQRNSFENITSPAIRLLPTGVFVFRRRFSPDGSWWLVAAEQSSTRSPLRLFHPLTRARIPLERFHQLCHDLEYKRLARGCTLRYKKNDTDNDNVVDDNTNNNNAVFSHLPERFCVSKVLLWSDPSFKNHSVVKLHTHGTVLECFRLPYWANQGVYNFKNCIRISLESDEPLANQGFKSLRIDDIEVWNGMLWAVDCQGRLFGIPYQTLKVSLVGGGGVSATGGSGAKRLLLNDGLCLVVCNTNNIRSCDEFSVYRFDFPNLKWDKVSTIGDWNVLFVGYDTCFMTTTQYLIEGFPGNCIVYPKNMYPHFSDNKPRDGVEFQGVEDYLELRLCFYGIGHNCVRISDYPMLSSVFWPPPVLMFKDLSFSESEANTGGNTSSNVQ